MRRGVPLIELSAPLGCLTTQIAHMMLDKAPINVEPTPYRNPLETQPLGFDVERSRVASEKRDELADLPLDPTKTLADIRRWQQSRMRDKATVDAAQHMVGFTSRLKSSASYLCVDEESHEMRLQREKEAIARRNREEEEIKELEKIRLNRVGEGSPQIRFEKRKDILIEELIKFPQRIEEAEREKFEETRKVEMSIALKPLSEAPLRPLRAKTQIVGNLTVVSLSDVDSGAKTHPKEYRSLQPSRLLIKQLARNVPTSVPFVPSDSDAQEGPLFRKASTGGSLIPSSIPPLSYTVVAHKVPQATLDAFKNPSKIKSEEDALELIQKENDILLHSHSYFQELERNTLRHPNAVNLNKENPTKEKESAKPSLQKIIEGSDTDIDVKVSTEGMTPLERQRYLDILETQRQADIADAFRKVKSFDSDTRQKQQLAKMSQSNGRPNLAHKKFTHADDSEMKAQYEYLQKLLSRDASGAPSTDIPAMSNGVQWIGTTPRIFTNRLHSFMLRVIGSAVLLAMILVINPSLLEPPPESTYSDTVPHKKSEILSNVARY